MGSERIPDRRERIERALDVVKNRHRTEDFEHIGTHVAMQLWPSLLPTAFNNDKGEDAITLSGIDPHRRKRSVACSVTGTLTKVKIDCAAIAQSLGEIDVLVFVTTEMVTNEQEKKWRKAINDEFGFDLEVIARTALVSKLERPESAWICWEYLHIEHPLFFDEPAESKIRRAARTHFEMWREEFEFDPGGLIDLGLEITDARKAQEPFRTNLSRVADLVRRFRRVVVLGSGGSGKSHGLLSVASSLLESEAHPIPVFISSPEWIASGGDIVSYIAGRSAFVNEGVTEQDLATLASRGRLAFLLDGWNETPQESQAIARDRLSDELHNAAKSVFLVCTRPTALPPQFRRCLHLRILPISRDARRQYLRTTCASRELERIIETDWALDELTRTPFFLDLVSRLDRSGLPQQATRYGLLEAAVDQTFVRFESHLATSECKGYHKEYLEALAREMTNQGASSLTNDDAQAAVARCGGMLVAQNRLSTTPNAHGVLDALARFHTLVRHVEVDHSYLFQHELFRDWYAAQWLDTCLTGFDQSDTEAASRLQTEVLDRAHWEGALSLVTEKLRGSTEDRTTTIADLLRLLIPIDIGISAILAGSLGDTVPSEVRDELSGALHEVMAQGGASSELAFWAMLQTGWPEFSEITAPVARDSTPTELYRFLRTEMVRPTCLGDDWRTVFGALSGTQRADLVWSLVDGGNPDAIDFAIQLAKTDPSPAVRSAAMLSLVFVGLFDDVSSLVGPGNEDLYQHDEYWQAVSQAPRSFLGPHADWLVSALDASASQSARHTILDILADLNDDRGGAFIESSLRSHEPQGGILYLMRLLNRVDPARASAFLAERLAAGEWWNERWLAADFELTDEQFKLVANSAASSTGGVHNRLQTLAAIDGDRAGAWLVNRYFDLLIANDNTTSDQHRKLSAIHLALHELPLSSYMEVVLDRAGVIADTDQLRSVLTLLGATQAFGGSLRGTVGETQLTRLRELILWWNDLRLESAPEDGFLRAQLAVLLGAIGTPEDTGHFSTWLQEERERVETEITARRALTTSYANWITGGLARLDCDGAVETLFELLNDPYYFGDACIALLHGVKPADDVAISNFDTLRPDYAGIEERRQRPGLSLAAGLNETTGIRVIEEIRRAFSFHLDNKVSDPAHPVAPSDLCHAAGVLAQLGDPEAVPFIVRMADIEFCESEAMIAIHRLVLAGVAVHADEVVDAFDPAIRRMERKTGSGSPGQDPWLAGVRFIAALLFSDDPSSGLTLAERALSAIVLSHHAQGLLAALTHCRAEGASELIIQIARSVDQHDPAYRTAVEALAAHPSTVHFDFLIEEWVKSRRVDVFASSLSQMVKSDSGCRSQLFTLAEEEAHGPIRPLLAAVLEAIGSTEAAIAACWLLSDESEKPVPFHVRQLINRRFTYHEPTEEGGGYWIRPRSCNELRRHLFHMFQTDPIRGRAALELLIENEVRRNDQGRPADEPRHPDIGEGADPARPWFLANTDQRC